MNERDEHLLQTATDRFERRLAEEIGDVRVEMANGFGGLRADLATGIGTLRAEMIERDHKLLKWGVVAWATQIGAVAALLALFR